LTLPLRQANADLRLMLRVARPATIVLNGATVRRNWRGRGVFEVGSALRPGFNVLDVRWRDPRQPVGLELGAASWQEMRAKVAPWQGTGDGEPPLRFEWLVGKGAVPEDAEDDEDDGVRLLRLQTARQRKKGTTFANPTSVKSETPPPLV
jgi:hypothetical protein